MRVFAKEELMKNMVDHPYETNPDFHAKVNFFFYSKDRKMVMAYYEAPEGWFDVEVKGFDEIDYVLEGEVELHSEGKTLTAKAGDCFLIQDGDRFRWKMKKPSKMVFFLYPITEEIQKVIESCK